MKTGKSLVELAQALERDKAASKDFIVPTSKIQMTEDNQIAFVNGSEHSFEPSGFAHSQIATYSDVPKAYYDRLFAENKALLAKNVNHGFDKYAQDVGRGGKTESRMIRTIDNRVRGFLSSSYRRIDSYDVMNETLPVMLDNKMQVVSSEITERRLYVKALTDKLTSEITKGDVVQYGLVISNSDVGSGSVRIEPLIYRLVCANGLIAQTAIKKYHVGKNQAENDVFELLSDKTKEMTDAAFFAQIRDVLLASLDPKRFEWEVNRLRDAATQKITNFDIPEVIELATKAVGVTGEGTKQNMLAYLANGADGAGLTKWGLVNAFTKAAQSDDLNYDDSTDLERAGAKILELPQSAWRRIAEVA